MLIFVCPVVLDFTIFCVLFAVSYGAGERGMSLLQCAWLVGILQISYMVTSLTIGLFLLRRNARAMLIASAAASGLVAVCCLAGTRFWPLFAGMTLMGLFTGVFFNAFQTFMRGEAPPGGLARVTGFYTLAWSLGAAFGLLMASGLYRMGPRALSALTLAAVGVVVFLLARHRPRPSHAPSADEHVEEGPEGARRVDPRYVWIGWIMIFTAMFVQRPIQTFYPAISARLGVAPVLAGLPLFLHMVMQGAGGWGMIRLRGVLYRRLPLCLVQAGCAGLLLALWRVPSYWLSAIGISVLGVWAGFAYFCAVYYASNSGRRSLNIGVNEFLVGLGSFVSLFAAERCMKAAGDEAMYAVCAVAVLVSVAAQWLIATAAGRRPAPPA